MLTLLTICCLSFVRQVVEAVRAVEGHSIRDLYACWQSFNSSSPFYLQLLSPSSLFPPLPTPPSYPFLNSFHSSSYPSFSPLHSSTQFARSPLALTPISSVFNFKSFINYTRKVQASNLPLSQNTLCKTNSNLDVATTSYESTTPLRSYGCLHAWGRCKLMIVSRDQTRLSHAEGWEGQNEM